MAFFAIPTLAGQAAIAAAIAGNGDLDLHSMVVGDGGGEVVEPVETWTSLVNLRATIGLQTVARDITDPTRVTIDCVIDENTGGWTIREAGVIDSSGQLLFVAKVPATEKLTLAQGAFDVLTLGLIVVVSESANITLSPGADIWATQEYVDTQIGNLRTNIGHPLRPYFVAVNAVLLNDPPDAPAVGSTYVIGDAPTGAWAGKGHQLAQWRGTAGWAYAVAPVATWVGDVTNGVMYRRFSSGWRTVMADNAEHLAGLSTLLHANPAGVKAMIDARFPANAPGALANDGTGVLSWKALLDIIGLTSTLSLANDDQFAVYKTSLTDNRRVSAQALKEYIYAPLPVITSSAGEFIIDLTLLDPDTLYKFYGMAKWTDAADGSPPDTWIGVRIRDAANANLTFAFSGSNGTGGNYSPGVDTVMYLVPMLNGDPDYIPAVRDFWSAPNVLPIEISIIKFGSPARVNLNISTGVLATWSNFLIESHNNSNAAAKIHFTLPAITTMNGKVIKP